MWPVAWSTTQREFKKIKISSRKQQFEKEMGSRCLQERMKNEPARHCHSAWSLCAMSLNDTAGENRLPVCCSFGMYLLCFFINANSPEDNRNLFSFWTCVFCSTQRPSYSKRTLNTDYNNWLNETDWNACHWKMPPLLSFVVNWICEYIHYRC